MCSGGSTHREYTVCSGGSTHREYTVCSGGSTHREYEVCPDESTRRRCTVCTAGFYKAEAEPPGLSLQTFSVHLVSVLLHLSKTQGFPLVMANFIRSEPTSSDTGCDFFLHFLIVALQVGGNKTAVCRLLSVHGAEEPQLLCDRESLSPSLHVVASRSA